MSYSIYDLTYKYLYKINKFDKQTKTNTLHFIINLIKNKWTENEILKAINENTLLSLNNTKPKVINLINPKRIYFHKELRITQKPPTLEFDYNTGKVIRTQEPYFLEMKSTYTINNIIKYYKDTINPLKKINEKRIDGAFRWLLKNYDLEILLYMIDISSYEENKILNPLDIRNCEYEAMEKYQSILKLSKLNGDDKIVPKRRLQHN